MSKLPLLLILTFSMSVGSTAPGLSAEIAHEKPLLRDGFVINGVKGNLIGPNSNDAWFFELISDVNDYKTVINAGTKLELLPSSALEKMIIDKNKRNTATYQLWNGRITKYKDRNYIFPNFFLPVKKTKKSQEKQDDPNDSKSESKTERSLAVNDPNDILTMPQEIIEKLKARREVTEVTRESIPDNNDISADKSRSVNEKEKSPNTQNYRQSSDSIFVDKTAFLHKQNDGQLVFVPDALGRNVQNLSFHLLPCATLELAEFIQAADPEPLRFKITGIVTKYKGKKYLLLEKATRAYSNGNFGR